MYIMVSSSDLTVTVVNPLINGVKNLQYVTYLSLAVKARENDNGARAGFTREHRNSPIIKFHPLQNLFFLGLQEDTHKAFTIRKEVK